MGDFGFCVGDWRVGGKLTFLIVTSFLILVYSTSVVAIRAWISGRI